MSTSLSDFTIVPATDDQMVQHARAAWTIWNRGLPWEDFLAATKKEYDVGDWGKDGGMHAWCLIKRDDPAGEIYSACEVYRRKALIRRKGQNDVEEGWMYAIASVVTPVQHLKKGYATHFLRLLHYILGDPLKLPPFPEAWGAPPPSLPRHLEDIVPNGIGSILYSDVGFKFYEKCTVGTSRPGWVVKEHQVTELVWDILPESSATDNADAQTYKWEWISKAQLPAIADKLKESMTSDLLDRKTNGTVYRADPTSPGLLDWLNVRGPWLAYVKPQHEEPLGIRTTSPDGVETIVLICAHNEHIGARLLITCVQNLTPDHLPSLLAQLDTVANRAGRKEGWIWGLELEGELVSAWKGLKGRNVVSGVRAEQVGHLLGVAWYGDENDQGEFAEWQMWDWC